MEISTRPIIAPINISSSGQNIIIPASTDKYIYIKQLVIIASGGANTLTLNKFNGSVAEDLSVLPMQLNGNFVFENTGPDLPFWIDIEPGKSFRINLSAATGVTGHVIYGYRK